MIRSLVFLPPHLHFSKDRQTQAAMLKTDLTAVSVTDTRALSICMLPPGVTVDSRDVTVFLFEYFQRARAPVLVQAGQWRRQIFKLISTCLMASTAHVCSRCCHFVCFFVFYFLPGAVTPSLHIVPILPFSNSSASAPPAPSARPVLIPAAINSPLLRRPPCLRELAS